MAAKLPTVKNTDRCLTWEAFPSPLQAGKPGNEWEAAGVGQDSLEGERKRAKQGPDPGRPAEVSWPCCSRGGREGAEAGPRGITLQARMESHQTSASRSHLLVSEKKLCN